MRMHFTTSKASGCSPKTAPLSSNISLLTALHGAWQVHQLAHCTQQASAQFSIRMLTCGDAAQPGERFRSFDAARQDRFVGRLVEFLAESRCTQVCACITPSCCCM